MKQTRPARKLCCYSWITAMTGLTCVIMVLSVQNGRGEKLSFDDISSEGRFTTSVVSRVLAKIRINEKQTLELWTLHAEGDNALTLQLRPRGGKEDAILWQAHVKYPYATPREYATAVSETSATIGLCFLLHWGDILFYEIDAAEIFGRNTVADKAKSKSSEWDGEGTLNDKSLTRREHVARSLSAIPNPEFRYAQGLALTQQDEQWVVSMRVHVAEEGEESDWLVTLTAPRGKKGESFRLISKKKDIEDAGKTLCHNRLLAIVAAKEQWALAEHKKTGDAVVFQQVDEYIKDGHPKCPKGGEYVYGVIGETPKCTIHGTSE